MIHFNTCGLLLITAIWLTLSLAVYILFKKEKKQIHYAFLVLLFSCFAINFVVLLKMIIAINQFYIIVLDEIFFLGYIFMPISLLFVGLIYAKTHIEFTWKYFLIFIVPIISILVLVTNNYHHLFYVNNSLIAAENVKGSYFMVHTIYSYICIIIGIAYLIYFSIKNSGFFSKQVILLVIGITVPLITDTFSSFDLVDWPLYIENIAFSFAMVCFTFAIFKFNFLNVLPVALKKVVDLISDGFIVLDDGLRIIDYNETLVNTFGGIISIKRQDYLINSLRSNQVLCNLADNFINMITMSINSREPISFEREISSENFDKCFTIEITPIYSSNTHIGTILLFKDITEHKKNIKIIEQTQSQLVEKERLASFGQLIGGISHNLKTPIMSIAGYVEGLKDLAKEYDESIEDTSVTGEDHHEISKEMLNWIEKIQEHLGYMSNVISSVKDQAVQLNDSSNNSFTLGEAVAMLQTYTRHELAQYNCNLNINNKLDISTELNGEVHNMVQVFYNIIINSIDSYHGRGGEIDFNVDKSNDFIEFIIKDYGAGIDSETKDKLFKQMITTKGKRGAGLGLYMSYSTIKGRFNGDIRVESEEGIGTTFYVIIPAK